MFGVSPSPVWLGVPIILGGTRHIQFVRVQCRSWSAPESSFMGGMDLQQSPSGINNSDFLSSCNFPFFPSRLVAVLRTAARSEKKDKNLPSVGLDLLRVSLKEGAFDLFWKEAVENGLLKEKLGPNRFVLECSSHFFSFFLLPTLGMLCCSLGPKLDIKPQTLMKNCLPLRFTKFNCSKLKRQLCHNLRNNT